MKIAFWICSTFYCIAAWFAVAFVFAHAWQFTERSLCPPDKYFHGSCAEESVNKLFEVFFLSGAATGLVTVTLVAYFSFRRSRRHFAQQGAAPEAADAARVS